ncbi:MAG: hypothetical protein Q8Q60_01945 [Candidatus Chromulinivorax sp.]|nr:hypothetical protein [Candidatus Chromulinivorax sp.]
MIQKNITFIALIIYAHAISSMEQSNLFKVATPKESEKIISEMIEIEKLKPPIRQATSKEIKSMHHLQTMYAKTEEDRVNTIRNKQTWETWHTKSWINIIQLQQKFNPKNLLDLNNEHIDNCRKLREQLLLIDKNNAAIKIQSFARKNAAQKTVTNMREDKIQADVACAIKKRENKKRHKIITQEMTHLTYAIIDKIWPIIHTKEKIEPQTRHYKKLVDAEFLNNIKKQHEKEKIVLQGPTKKSKKSTKKSIELTSPTSITVTSTTTVEPIEATIEISTELQQSEYNNYIKWVSEREQEKEKLKATLTKQYHQNNRDKRYNKDERNKTIELNFNKKFLNNHPEEEAINRVFQQYENTLNTQNTSIEQIIYIEKCFQKAEELLLQAGRSIKWYFANRPDLEVRIKDRIKTIQKMTLQTEQKSYRIMRNCMIPQLQNNNDDTLYQLQQTSLLLKKQQEIIYKIQSFHTHNGYLDTSKLKNPGFSNLDNKGIISLETLHKTEQDITAHLLSATETSMRSIAPIITHVLQQANIDTSPFLIKSIMDSASMIAIHPDRGDSSDILDSDRFMNEIQASLFRTLYQQNRLVSEPETEDQMADKVKIHISVIKAYIKAVQTKS